ncbi:undecaprenyldiphospho-muramoylpentapeptide beta-N-acetylglucosaminyltransferase [Flavihumibacter sp. ZG627]|uniref:undecaprenyldiphospho-muramoylpentapeptide beta-N-acetylglucosaminyltransferase n=1 Tax=Flavihumibacter sp. ZG627 TaxID=1463156 RepID=UPI00057F1B82|nr:undecaprenyldiphospho-muramoylpentapeptide beta-N-acetylglucosaminyltransferase [Flavihumibacter sp. ZG627]KIC92533.1 UDP-diphospho-muramoylpentapeptide beta-N-acetylglucosaminyltransferase [Flavihumibacter sp. ZG627]
MGKRIIIAGGGTGGHIFPAIAIANALKKQDPSVEILFIGAKGKMEMEKVPQSGYEIKGLDIAGFNRSSVIKNISLPFKLIRSFFQVRSIFRYFIPDAVFGVGGYSSFPVLRYAQQKRIPTFLHEANAFAGKSNQILGRKATRVFVATGGMDKFFPANKIKVTGNPVRASIVHAAIKRDDALRFFGLDPERKTILSIGGSLGAKSINEAIDAGLSEFEKNDLQLIWQTGKPYAQRGKEAATGHTGIWVDEFISRMENAYAAADLIISRAGAMAIAEICVVNKPVILVPYPHAAEDHQTVNARNLVSNNAALMITDKEAAQKLVPTVIALAKDQALQNKLIENITPLGIMDADDVIAKEVLSLIV